MTQTLQTRLKSLLAVREMSEEQASKLARLDRSYMRKLLANPQIAPKVTTLARLADALGVTAQWLLSGEAGAPDMPPQFLVPVMGYAAAGLGDGPSLLTEPIYSITPPAGLVNAPGAYALIVRGSSMAPRYFDGEPVFASPHRKPAPGDHVIVRAAGGNAKPVAWLKILVREERDSWIVDQYERSGAKLPQHVFLKKYVTAVHRVLPMNELFGIFP
jgi:SOS-response transcriptional repressor LexA